MIMAILSNFGTIIYDGFSLYDAMEKVEAAGFEAVVYNLFDETRMTYSPIGGWQFS